MGQTLAAYLKAHDITQEAFARRVGVHQATISKICDGKKEPGWDLAVKIERATGGAVLAAGWPKFGRIVQHVVPRKAS